MHKYISAFEMFNNSYKLYIKLYKPQFLKEHTLYLKGYLFIHLFHKLYLVKKY